jgi:C-terminal processing protease CtpA/Prc
VIAVGGRTVAEIQAAEGINAVFDSADTLEFTIRELDDSEFSVLVTKSLVTIDPLPQHRVIDTPTGSVGYVELATFISTADAEFDAIFASFRQAGITDVILDLRYNGGGLVSTTELLGDFLGGAVAENLVFSKTLFNDLNSASNRTRFFQRLTNSMSLSRLVVVATSNTASASELITNSMESHAEVAIVGGTTFGKPVGQLGIEFCDKILRPTSFETVNADDTGGYFDGLPVDCAAADDLSIPVGDASDPNLVAALSYLSTGACPVASLPAQMKIQRSGDAPRIDRRGPAWREFAGAY